MLEKPWSFVTHLRKVVPDCEIFVVGGAVRDFLLKLPVKDYDLVIRGIEIDQLIAALGNLGEVNVVGKRFGVIKFKPRDDDRTFDIALPRRERSINFSGAYRDFEIQSDHGLPIEEDLARRDFTINAMAYNLATHEVVDPFFGQKDLRSKTIRTVGSAATRFQEDYSRMLRAVRFACRLGFTISDSTAAAIKKMVYHLHDQIDGEWVVSREVLSSEFLKAFDARPRFALELMDSLGVLETILPEITALKACDQTPPYHTEGTAYDHLLLALDALSSQAFKEAFPNVKEVPLMTKLGVLFHDIGKPVSASEKNGVIHFYGHEKNGAEMTAGICDRLNLGSTPYYPFSHQQLVWIVREHLFSIKYKDKLPRLTELEAMFFSPVRPGQSLLQTMLADQLASLPDASRQEPMPALQLVSRLKDLAPEGLLPAPLLSGNDVLLWTNIPAGPRIGEILADVREQQLNRLMSSREQAKRYIERTYGRR